jgi:hypothetical protein
VTARRLIVGAIALLLAVMVVRNSAIDALAEVDPARAAQFWGSHPATEISLAMTGVARAARLRSAVPPGVFERIDDAARKAPLAPEPFLVHGVQAQMAGHQEAAERSFRAAEWRDPRSLPAHYFLAERYFAKRDAERALKEIASLANLSPGGVVSSAPYLAAFAGDPSNWPRMRALFRANPRIEEAALIELSRDGRNAPAVLALASPKQRTARAPWLSVLVNTLVSAGEYAKARAIWGSISGANAAAQPLFDAEFSRPDPPPPFNWSFASSTLGLAERQSGGRLHAIFYGQEDGALAKQLLVLRPGRYRLSMRLLSGSSQVQALNWSVTCAGAQNPAASVPLNVAASRGFLFDVVADCRAQWLQLSGVSGDLPQQSDVTISDLKLVGDGSHG